MNDYYDVPVDEMRDERIEEELEKLDERIEMLDREKERAEDLKEKISRFRELMSEIQEYDDLLSDDELKEIEVVSKFVDFVLHPSKNRGRDPVIIQKALEKVKIRFQRLHEEMMKREAEQDDGDDQ